jgi:mono/diheme cytochrome c family protein
MPAFAREHGGGLTEAQLKVLANGIKTTWRAEASRPDMLPAYALGAGNVQRGAQAFQRACAGCHGQNGAGDEQNGSTTLAINSTSFLALISDQALRRIIITGRPDLGMPTYTEGDGRPADFESLTSAEIDDIVSLLASWRITNNVARIGQH